LKANIHDIKGSGGGFGFPQISEIAGKIEFQLLKEDFSSTASLIEDLASICERIYKGMSTQSGSSISTGMNNQGATRITTSGG